MPVKQWALCWEQRAMPLWLDPPPEESHHRHDITYLQGMVAIPSVTGGRGSHWTQKFSDQAESWLLLVLDWPVWSSFSWLPMEYAVSSSSAVTYNALIWSRPDAWQSNLAMSSLLRRMAVKCYLPFVILSEADHVLGASLAVSSRLPSLALCLVNESTTFFILHSFVK